MQPAKRSVPIVKNILRSSSINAASTVGVDDVSRSAKPWKDIPGPSSFPVIGPVLHFLPGGQFYKLDTWQATQMFYKMYGPIMKIDEFFRVPAIVMLFDPEAAAVILRGENILPNRPGFITLEYYRKNIKKGKGHSNETAGLITDQGDKWKQFRTKVNPVMLQPKTIKLYNTVIDEVAMDMVKRMKSLRNEENKIENKFDVEMNLWALESIGVVALGSRLNCFDPNLPENSKARKLIICIHELFKLSNELDFKPGLWRYFPTKMFKHAMKLYEEQELLAKYFIDKAKEDLKSKCKDSEDEKGVLEKLLEIDENIANIMATDMLFAGVDTAANTVTATMYLLAVNPEKQTKLRQEILSKKEKRYLKACIKEAMRIIPVVGGNIRQTTKEYNLLGYHIPKGTNVALSHWFMSMQQSNFPKPEEYIPERWLTDKEDPLYYGKGHPFAFNPFGFGVRSCIGRRIAELEVETFLSRVLENFAIEWYGDPPKITTTSLNYVTEPFNFIFKDI